MGRKQEAVSGNTERLIEELCALYGMEHISFFTDFLRGELRILDYLDRCGQDSVLPGELSEKLFVSSARIAAALGALEKKGYVRRVMAPDDRRKVLVSITGEGGEYVRTRRASVVAAVDAAMCALGEEDASHLVRIIGRLSEFMRVG